MKTLKNIAFVYRIPRHAGRSLITSIIEEIKDRGINLHEYNLFNERNTYDASILDELYAKRNDYDLVLVLDLGYLFDNRIHKDAYSCPVVMISGDDPQNFYPPKGLVFKIKHFLKSKIGSIVPHNELIGNSICATQYDIVFTSQKFMVEKYQQTGIKNVQWLPYWADSRLFKVDESIKPEFDVTTVMIPRLRRKATIEFLQKCTEFTFQNKTCKYGQETAQHYQKGKIVFNQSNHGEFTIRIAEALACKRLLVTDEISKESGLYDFYEPGKHFVTYTDLTDLRNKLAYYATHDSEREQIAQAGYDEVMKNHTEKNRVDFIFEVVTNYEKQKLPKKVSFHVISWNRPWLLEFTLSSLHNALKKTNIDYELIVFDQNSYYETQQVLKNYFGFITKIVRAPGNVGMAKAWVGMYENSNAEYIVPVENDWWCNATNDKWLTHAIEIMEKHPEVAFTKLRTIDDRQYGTGSLAHESWTIKPFRSDIIDVNQTQDGTKYYVTDSIYNCFTFNPMLMRKQFRDEFDLYYQDNANNYDPLRSGEDLPSDKWRAQNKWRGATLTDGPFKHTGFPELKEHLRYSSLFLIKHFFNLIRTMF